MLKIFVVCMLIGLIVPFFSIVCSLFDGFVDFSADLFDLDFGDISISFLPISINSICMALLLYGGIGYTIVSNGNSYLVANITGGVVGYVGVVTIQTLIKHLRKKQTLADTEDMMLAREGKVVTAIEPNKFGSVILSIEGSSDIQYTAKNVDTVKLTTKDKVEVVSFEDGIANIRRKISLEDKYN